MFSQIIAEKEHKNRWLKFGSLTWCYKPHSIVQLSSQSVSYRRKEKMENKLCGVNLFSSSKLVL